MKFQPIAIVGQSCILPGVFNPEELWISLVEGRNFLSNATNKDWNLDPRKLLIGNDKSSTDKVWNTMGGNVRGFEKIFDPSGFLLETSFIQSLDPLFQWTLHCGREVLNGIDWENSRERTAVVLGNLSYPTPGFNELAQTVWLNKKHTIQNWRNRFIAGYPAQLLSESLGLKGSAFCVDAACASSIYAIKNACDLLHSHEADLAISGGINASEGSFLNLGFTALNALSRSGISQPFSKNANGLVPSRGAAFVSLRRFEDAVRLGEPILGVIRGIGLSNDGRRGSLLSPSTKAQELAIRKAYEISGLHHEQTSHIEVHATGTLLGDRCELESLLNVFQPPQKLSLGSLKANMGHLLAASGTAALLKILAAFKYRTIPPVKVIENPIEDLQNSSFEIPSKPKPWESKTPRIAAINAFGFGGNNAHLIVEEYIPQNSFHSTEPAKKEALAIVGVGVRWGELNGKGDLLKALQKKLRIHSTIDSFELDLKRLNFPPSDIPSILPQQLLLIPTVEEALSDLKTPPDENTGILVGMSTDPEASRFKLRLDRKHSGELLDDETLPALTAARTLGCMPNIPANRFNLLQNWKGPSYSVLGEENSGHHLIQLACKALRNYEVNCMVVAAVDLCCEPVHQETVLRCFTDARYKPADGAVVLVLKRLCDAEKAGDKIFSVVKEADSLKCSKTLEEKLDSNFGRSHVASGLFYFLSDLLQHHHPSYFSEAIIKNGETKHTVKVKAHLPQLTKPLPLPPKLSLTLPLYSKKPILFDSEAIREHASGNLSNIFGELFKEIDSYSLRVRMPEPPLLLTDRIVKIQAEKASMKCGTIVTETDIDEGAWYLHNGRMLAGPSIEAGQSDLFLISYLGIDFEMKGERAYRLLGCDAQFLRDLPKVGETLRFEITIDRHVKSGKTRLFFFHYDCWIGKELFLQVRNGQAGFFSREELDASQGVICDPSVMRKHTIASQHPITKPRSQFSKEQVRAFSNGDAYFCFGSGYENLASHARTPNLPSANNLLFDEVIELEPNGYLKVTRTLSEQDWFFQGHFKNDPCMPGTLMTEMAFQALSFYLTALGYTLNCDGFRFIPSLGETCKLTCRGQIVPESKHITMEVFVKGISQSPSVKAYADILLSVDGLKALLAENLSVQLIPDWMALDQKIEVLNQSKLARFEGIFCDELQISHTVSGKPSLAWGSAFSRFDLGIRPARLPRYPYTFLSRICKIDGPYCGMKVGTRIISEWDIPQTHPLLDPYSPHIPFSVMLEALLQPCGWLASYIGCPTASDKEIFFRNLEGEWILHENPLLRGTVELDVQVTSLVRLNDTIIIEFKVSAFSKGRCFVEVKTRFGYFTLQALSDQKGISLTSDEQESLDSQEGASYSITEQELSAHDWFFKAHFFQDPVMPGSLGLEAMLQSYQNQLIEKGFAQSHQFSPLNVGTVFSWKYRGQVLPQNRKITILTRILSENHASPLQSSLLVDGKKIYEASFNSQT